MRERLAPWLAVAVLAGCADPCAGLGEPVLELGASNIEGTSFEPFEDGAALPLVWGPQIGMHVWLNLRLTGFCMPDVDVERRIVTPEPEELVYVTRGPLDFVEDPARPGAWVLPQAVTMILCPTETRPVIDQPFRFAVRAEDSLGRGDVALRPFVAACVTEPCELCVPP